MTSTDASPVRLKQRPRWTVQRLNDAGQYEDVCQEDLLSLAWSVYCETPGTRRLLRGSHVTHSTLVVGSNEWEHDPERLF